MEHKECCQCEHCKKTKERSPEAFRALVNRIENMLENNAYCTDILVQVAAANAALNAFNRELLASHIKSCVAQNIREGNDEVIDELVNTLQKLMK